MNTATLEQVLAATGYLPDGQPAPGLRLGAEAQSSRHGRVFVPDALWRSASSLTVYFKFEQSAPADDLVSQWRREVWNEGFAPLLWVISPQRIDLYNGFGTPAKEGDAQRHLIRRFENIEASLHELDELAGDWRSRRANSGPRCRPSIARPASIRSSCLTLDVSNAIWSQAISRAMRRRP